MKLPRVVEKRGGEDKLTVKRFEILGLPGILSNLHLYEDSSRTYFTCSLK
jgi:hypothetical protein